MDKVISIAVLLIFYQELAVSQEPDIEFHPETRFSLQDGDYVAEDGDSFWIGIHRIGMHGIDTIEATQRCSVDNRDIPCHERTMPYLEGWVRDPNFYCLAHLGKQGLPRLNHSRYISTCFLGDEELNAKMVLDGWAVAARGADGNRYRELESDAAKRKVGIHQWQFEHPHDFRNPDPEDCICDP